MCVCQRWGQRAEVGDRFSKEKITRGSGPQVAQVNPQETMAKYMSRVFVLVLGKESSRCEGKQLVLYGWEYQPTSQCHKA